MQISSDSARQRQPSLAFEDLQEFCGSRSATCYEQRAIAAALSDVDALLGGLDRLIAKKRDLKQAAMQQLLTGQTRLPGFHGEWEVKTLGELFNFSGGLFSFTRPALILRATATYTTVTFTGRQKRSLIRAPIIRTFLSSIFR